MAAYKYIRNENNEIVEKKEIIESSKYYNDVAKLQHDVNIFNGTLNKKRRKKEKIEQLNEYKRLLNEIERLNNCIVYNHFDSYNFNVPAQDKLQFTPILSEKQKQKSKLMSNYFKSKNKNDSVMITLEK